MRSFDHIAKLIKEKRQMHEKRYSQAELSHLLGYKNGQFISNVERGLCSIPLKMLSKLCQILNVPAEELKAAVLKDEEQTLNNYLKTTGTVNPRHNHDNLKSIHKNNGGQGNGSQEVA